MASYEPHDHETRPGDGDYRVFHPVGARIVAVIVAVIFGGMLCLVAYELKVGPIDWAGFGGLAVVVAWLMYRLGGVRAVPSRDGLVVRNVFVTTKLEWSEIVNVRFGDAPWPQLDLADGDVLSVMGIQRADGARSQSEAVRLANLVQRHGTAEDH